MKPGVYYDYDVNYPTNGMVDFDAFSTRHDLQSQVYWITLQTPFFESRAISRLRQHQEALAARLPGSDIQYVVLESSVPGVFSLGGDMSLFLSAIRAQDRCGLEAYASACLELVRRHANNYGNSPLTTIAVVSGLAYGGGFEAVLANDIIIMEENVVVSFPEPLFNMFPGMGAYQLLSRRVPAKQAEKILLSGRTYTAKWLYDSGIIDFLVPTGQAHDALWDFIGSDRKHARKHLHAAITDCYDAIDEQDSRRFLDRWVDAAMSLEKRDLTRLEHLSRAQVSRRESLQAVHASP